MSAPVSANNQPDSGRRPSAPEDLDLLASVADRMPQVPAPPINVDVHLAQEAFRATVYAGPDPIPATVIARVWPGR